jgi:Tol biopolymer transport system component
MHRIPASRSLVVAVLAAATAGCGDDRSPVKLQNTAPEACFVVSPAEGTPQTAFQVDASCSSDGQDSTSSLSVRWDWEGDGTWDTAFTTAKTASHTYGAMGVMRVRLEVQDTELLATTAAQKVTVMLPLTTDPAFDVYPQWSPDGSRIAFRSSRSGEGDLWSVSSTGGDATQLTFGPAVGGTEGPQWSADGQRIAFASDRAGIWVLPGAGGQAVQLTTDPQDRDPRWSPDGTRIAFYSYRYYEETLAWDIWVVPSEGGTEVCLTAAYFPDAVDPEWSPDGTRIAFVANLSGPLWVIPAAGGEAIQLTALAVNGGFQWSPDGSWIAFGSGPIGDVDLWIVPATGGEAVRLTNEPGIDWDPTWSPDGNWIAFVTNRGWNRNYDVWVMPAAGGEGIPLTSEPSSDQVPQWSPDGGRIAFESYRNGNWDVWVLPVDL